MTLQELILGNIKSGQTAAIMDMGANTANSASNSVGSNSFKNILDRKIYTNQGNQNANKSRKGDYSDKSAETVAAGQKYKTYLEAQKAHVKPLKEKKSGSSQNKKADGAGVEKEDMAQEPINTVSLIAHILGVNTNELQKLLDETGIVLESAADVEGISENVSRLSQLLGLNDSQHKAMTQLLQMAQEALEALEDLQEDQTGTVVQIQDEALTATAEQLNQSEDEFEMFKIHELVEKLEMQIKSKLEELHEGLANDSQALEHSIKEALKPFINNASVKIQMPQETPEDVSIEVSGQTLSKEQSTQQKSLENSSRESKPEDTYRKGHEAGKAVLSPDNSQIQAAFAILEPNKTAQTSSTQIMFGKTVPVTPKEIINQIIEKTSVFITPEKSEMNIELKPDSLGKLSLKIASENGIITAKFIADSHQVKQVLESNMELLKDSLERQGMNVEGFSVSVRQDSQQSARHFNQMNGVNSSKKTGSSFTPAGIDVSREALYGSETVNSTYRWENSTINLTA